MITSINEWKFLNNLFKKKQKRTIPEFTPDPIPANADWWWNNDIFVFGSNTQGNHAGGAAKAAVLYYGAIMGQARGLQGNSYGIVTLDYTGNEPVTTETIGQELDTFIEFANSHKSLTFWMTKIGTGISRIPFDQIAQLFFDRKFPSNVKLPEEFFNNNINENKTSEFINEAVDIKSDIIDVELLTQYATAIELLCNGEYGYTYFDPEKNYIAICLGDSNPFGEEELYDWIKWSVCDYKDVELIKVEIDCEWVPDTPYMFKNGKWTKK